MRKRASVPPGGSAPKLPKLTMLLRCWLTQWPVGEERDEFAWPVVTFPNGDSGTNALSGYPTTVAQMLGYIIRPPKWAANPDSYHRWVRTDKPISAPRTYKVSGMFPISRELHECLVWGHPVWTHLRWVESLAGRGRFNALYHVHRHGRQFGKHRWALAKWLLRDAALPYALNGQTPGMLLLLCGVYRLGLDIHGKLAILPPEQATQILLEQFPDRECLLQRVTL